MTTHRDEHSRSETPTQPDASLHKTLPDTGGGDPARQANTGPFLGAVEEAGGPAAFGRYRVERVFRSGGFGTIYLAHDPRLDRRVAIKVPRRDLRQEDANAFLREAQRVARLRHPGIVVVHDAGIQGQRGYIVSDFVEGTALNDWLHRGRPPWRQALRIVAAVADALAHAHAQSTVHRDVKPSNIILTEAIAPVLIDFGLALTESEVVAPSGGSVGTPAYMSPEQAAGKGHRIDGRTDIYSLGVVLYEMLTGRRPHRSPDMDELVRQVCEDEPQPPRQLVPSLPRKLEHICLKAMAKRIGDRYTTADDFAQELRDLLDTDPEPAAAPPSLPVHGREKKKTLPRMPQPTAEALVAEQASQKPTLPVFPPGPAPAPPPRADAPQDTTPRSAERRQVTALFCSFAAAGAAEEIDPEDEQELLLAATRVCKDVIARFQGKVIGSAGEGLLASFGFPVAQEDAARQAVSAGLAILEAVRTLPPQGRGAEETTVSARVAIHTGFALVGDWSGPEGEALTVVGEARNVATRLEGLADAGQVLISAATQRLVQGFFVCANLGTHSLKGLARALDVFRVLHPCPARHHIEAAAVTGLTPLIGRDQEVGLLRDRWEQAREGMGQVLLLVGEPGIGKSRLVHVLREHVRHESGGHTEAVVEWRCSPHFQNTALYPAADFLAGLLDFSHTDDPRARTDRLSAHLRSLGMDEPEVVPLFATLLSLPPDPRYPPMNLSPQGLKERTLEALAGWLQRYARGQAVLFIVEDLHWMDATTQELLGRLLAQVETERLLAIFTFRPEYSPPWTSRTPQTQVVLNRLTRRQVGDLMQRKLGVQGLPAALLEQVAARTDGVPLFVEEFTQMVVELRCLRVVAGQAELTDALPLHAIPATLQDLLTARLDRMASVKDVVQMAAVLGRTFSYELLRAVAPVDETTLQGELAKLVAAEVLHQKGRPPRCSYVFKHALIQDAAYQLLVKSQRQQVHRRVAEVLEERFPELVQAQPEVVAHHYSEAGRPAQALPYWEKAALSCQDRSANSEGIGHIQRGLELLAGLEDSRERDVQELRLQVLLAVMLQAMRGYAAPEVSAVHARARQLSERLGEPALHFQVLWGMWAWRFIRDELDLGLELAEEVLRLARAQQDLGILMEACFAPGCNLFYRGDFAASRTYCEQGFALYTPERGRLHARHTGQNSGVTNQCYSGVALWFLGYPEQAEARIAQAVALARELSHPFTLVFALYHHALLQQLLRRGAEAQSAGEMLEALSTEQGFPFWKALGQLCRGAGLLLRKEYTPAAALLRQGLSSYRATGAGVTVSHYHALLGAAEGGAGRFPEAQLALADGLAVAERFHERFVEAELHRLRGELLLRQPDGDPAEAEACLRRALEVACQQQARSLQLRAATSLYRLCPSGQTREILSGIYNWFDEGLATADLADARTLLEGGS